MQSEDFLYSAIELTWKIVRSGTAHNACSCCLIHNAGIIFPSQSALRASLSSWVAHGDCLSPNEGAQREFFTGDFHCKPGPHKAMLVLGQKGPGPHAVPVRGPRPSHRGPLSKRRGQVYFRRRHSAWLVSFYFVTCIYSSFFTFLENGRAFWDFVSCVLPLE